MDIKQNFVNNVIVQMAGHMDPDQIRMLELAIMDELATVIMQGVTTLPLAYRDSVNGKNSYIIQLFISKKRLAKDTKKAYLLSVRQLLVLISHKPLSEMEGSDIQYYINWFINKDRNGKTLEPSTVNNERRNLSAFFKWMTREGIITRNPVDAVEPVWVPWKPIDYFSPEELLEMRDACRNERERAILEVLRSTGARAGELVDIKLDQVDLTTGDIPILGEKRGRWRTLYLDPEARYYLQKYLNLRVDNSPYLFPKGKYPYTKMGTSGLRSLLKGIGQRAGLSCRVYPHKMRKTLGMTLINREVDIGVIQSIMGHASPEVTSKYYAQLTPAALRRIRERAA